MSDKKLTLTIPELIERTTAQSWLVKNVLPATSLGLVFGASQTLKSFICLDMALSLNYGMQWAGQKSDKIDAVYVSAEGGAGIAKRIKAWHIARKMDVANCPLRVVIDHIDAGSDLLRLRKEIESLGINCRLIILDTFSQLFPGDENAADQVAAFLRMIVRHLILPLQCTVILVHHVGHAVSERPRGSSALTANADVLFAVYKSAGERIAIFENVKQKDAELFPPLNFHASKIELGQDEDGDPISSLSAAHIVNPADISAAVMSASGGHKKLVLELAGQGLTMKEARKQFYEQHGGDTDAKQKAWRRSLNWAISAQLVSESVDGLLQRTPESAGHQPDIKP